MNKYTCNIELTTVYRDGQPMLMAEVLTALNAATPPADAALADDELLISDAEAFANKHSAATHPSNADGWLSQMITLAKKQAAALRARAVPELYCVGRASYPPRGGNVGINWHVVGVADVPYRTCVPKNGELLFVLAASKAAEGKV